MCGGGLGDLARSGFGSADRGQSSTRLGTDCSATATPTTAWSPRPSALGTDPVPFEQLVSLIDESRLAFDPDTRTGVVPLAGNSDLGGGTESVVLGRDAAEVRDLKGRLSACIAGRARTEGA